MQPDALSQLSNAIQAAVEAVAYPLLLVAVVAALVSAVVLARSYIRERRNETSLRRAIRDPLPRRTI